MSDERYDYQQQLEEEMRRQEEDRAWRKHWRETWQQWAKRMDNEFTETNERRMTWQK